MILSISFQSFLRTREILKLMKSYETRSRNLKTAQRWYSILRRMSQACFKLAKKHRHRQSRHSLLQEKESAALTLTLLTQTTSFFPLKLTKTTNYVTTLIPALTSSSPPRKSKTKQQTTSPTRSSPWCASATSTKAKCSLSEKPTLQISSSPNSPSTAPSESTQPPKAFSASLTSSSIVS